MRSESAPLDAAQTIKPNRPWIEARTLDFDAVVRLHRLSVCIVTEILCEDCVRVVVLSDGSLRRMVACPGCGNAARTLRTRIRAATSRELPWAGILKVRAGSLVFLARKLECVIPAAAADHSRFDRQLLRLGLNGNPEHWRTSEELKIWVEANRDKTYVPESLLLAWNLDVYERDVNLSKSE